MKSVFTRFNNISVKINELRYINNGYYNRNIAFNIPIITLQPLYFTEKRLMKLNIPKTKAKPAVEKSESKRDILFGTGITKRVAEQAEKLHEKDQKSGKSAIKLNQITDESAFKAGELPSTLMDSGIVLDQYQTAALRGLRNQKYGCLIGAAGTGKTTTLKALIAEVEDAIPIVDINSARRPDDRADNPQMNVAVCFCSFTGRAVQQMKRALPEKYHGQANTAHSTLGYAPTKEERYDEKTGETKDVLVFRPTFDQYNKLPYKVCIIDEAGTLPIILFDQLVDALPSDCRIFLIGDLNQLPPVQGRSVLGFAMLKWPTFTLEELHRQAEGDPIAENAHRVLRGQKPLTDKETKKFIVKKIDDGSLGARKTALATVQHLHKQGIFDPMRDALIVPQNISAIGQLELNQSLVNYFNPPVKDETGKVINKRTIITAGYAHVVYAAGDKIMLLANDNKRNLTNGMIGMVESIVPNGDFRGESVSNEMDVAFEGDFDLEDLTEELMAMADEEEAEDESERAASHIMTVKFQNVDETVVFETAGAFKNVTHAYAFTCHKAQGGEYPNVIILAHSANLRMLTREWLYTAITRAQKRVILLCNHRGLTHAVNNQRIKGKTIAEKAEQFLALQSKDDTQLPNLPEPEEIRYAKISISA